MFSFKREGMRRNQETMSTWRIFWSLAAPYWTSEAKWGALALLIMIMSMNLGMVYVRVLINDWTRGFYNALQAGNKAEFFSDLWRFAGLATTYIIQAVYMLYLNQMLQIRWRRWLTEKYLSNWLTRQAYYRMQFLGDTTDNPDQRISEDIGSFIELTMTLSVGLLSAVATLISFVVILWQLSGTLSIPVNDFGTFNIPGYMVWAAIAYAAIGTWLTLRIGNPLIELNFNQQRFEADFRFSMARLRENGESVALYRGEKQEQASFLSRFGAVVSNYWEIMKRRKKVSWLTSGYNQLAIIFPVLMAAPRFFSKQMDLGGLMQTVSAFHSVHEALSYLINSYTTIANWTAVLNRLTGFNSAIERVETIREKEECTRLHSANDSLSGTISEYLLARW